MTGLEVSEQAQKVAKEAAMRMGLERRKRTAPLPKKETVRDHETIPLPPEVDGDDKLPPGMKWQDLPRFIKVQGWEKDSKIVR